MLEIIYIFVKQAFEIELLKVLNVSLSHLLLVMNLFREHAEMGACSHLELSAKISQVLRNKNVCDFGKLPYKFNFKVGYL